MELCFDNDCNALIEGKIVDDKPNVIKVVFRDYNSEEIIEEQSNFSDFIIELIGMVSAIMFPYGSELNKIEKMIKNDGAFDRSQTFSNSVFYGMETLGKDTFSFASVEGDFEDMKMKRKQKSKITNIIEPEDQEVPVIPEKVHYSKPPEGANIKNVSNADVMTC